MESFSCSDGPTGGIKPLEYLGFYVMNKAQNLLLSGTMAIVSIFAANAQEMPQGKLITMNDANKTEISVKNDVLTPVVRPGSFTDAERLSAQNNLLVIHISGGKGTEKRPETYSAKQYGEVLQKAFKSTDFTNNPTDIVVFYQETGKNRITVANILINGDEYTTKSGKSVFTPLAIGKYVDVFADAYAKTKGITAYNPNTSKSTGIALNNE